MNELDGPLIPVQIGGDPPTHWGWMVQAKEKAVITLCGRGSNIGPRARPAGTPIECELCLKLMEERIAS